MIQAIIFPCNIFSLQEVDFDFQNEYTAAIEVGGFEIYFYDYEQFVRDGILRLNRRPEEKISAVLRGWMLNTELYERFYNLLLERNINLITNPEQYRMMHLFPNVYPLIEQDTPGILVYPECENNSKISLSEIKTKFNRFMIKDFVKSEKGTDFPKFFDSSISEEDFSYWLKVFREYRGKLFTGGFCIKEIVDLRKYGERTNEWRVFYLNGNIISVSKNSGQPDFASEVPKSLIEKYKNLPSPFYTVDYAELSDSNWKILEAGDGQVSGLSDRQDAMAFFRTIQVGA